MSKLRKNNYLNLTYTPEVPHQVVIPQMRGFALTLALIAANTLLKQLKPASKLLENNIKNKFYSKFIR